MITFKQGNLLESDADCLVNTVNCEGYMGKGVAYQFKTRFPENNRLYVKECRQHNLTPGKVLVTQEEGRTIVNFPTKDKWREPSRLEYIQSGMDAMIQELSAFNIHAIAIPPLGCGNGGLRWDDVRRIIETELEPLKDKYDFYVFAPSEISTGASIKQPPKLNLSSLVLIDIYYGLISRSKIRIQKAAYFLDYYLNERYFKFEKAKYGPYSYSIECTMCSINEYQQYYQFKTLKEVYDNVYRQIISQKTEAALKKMHPAIEESLAFVNSIENTHVLEGVATSLFLIEGGPCGLEEIWTGFNLWPGNKGKRFSQSEISKFTDILQERNLITVDLFNKFHSMNE